MSQVANHLPYQQRGFKTRFDYLENLSESYGVLLREVIVLSMFLGAESDFSELLDVIEEFLI